MQSRLNDLGFNQINSSEQSDLRLDLESLRIELRASGVDVTLVVPGFVRTKPGGKRKRPFVVELETATGRIDRAIVERRPILAFPWTLALAIRFATVLPPRWRDALVSRLAP